MKLFLLNKVENVVNKVENIVAYGEIAHFWAISPFITMFSKVMCCLKTFENIVAKVLISPFSTMFSTHFMEVVHVLANVHSKVGKVWYRFLHKVKDMVNFVE